MDDGAAAAESFWNGAGTYGGGPLMAVAQFLERRDLPAFFAVCRGTAPLGRCEWLWQSLWPWQAGHSGGGRGSDGAPAAPRRSSLAGRPPPPLFAASWHHAHQLVAGLYARGDLEPVPLLGPGTPPPPPSAAATTAAGGSGGVDAAAPPPPPDEDADAWPGGEEVLAGRAGADITCPCYSRQYRIYGYSDGVVRVFGGGSANSSGSGGGPFWREFHLRAGSIRHMQLVAPTPAPASAGAAAATTAAPGPATLLVGSWDGAVHAVTLPDGPVAPVVSALGGPVYGLRLSGPLLFTCCGDAAIYVWDTRTQPAAPLGRLEGHAGAVTDFTVDVLPAPLLDGRQRSDTASSRASSASHHRRRQAAQRVVRRVVSSSYDGSLRVWHVVEEPRDGDGATTYRVQPLTPAPLSPTDVGGSPPPAAASESASALSYACVATLAGHKGPVWSVAAVDGGYIFSSSADGTIRVWRVVDGWRAADGVGSSSGAWWPDDVLAPMRVVDRSATAAPPPSLVGGGAASAVSAGVGDVDEDDDASDVRGGVVVCERVLAPYASTTAHRQLWCLRVAGEVVLAGASDGRIFAFHALTGRPLWRVLATGAHVAPADDDTAASAAAAAAASPGVAAAAAGGPLRASERDGIRRLDLVGSRLYTCTSKGRVAAFRFCGVRAAGGGGSGSGASHTPAASPPRPMGAPAAAACASSQLPPSAASVPPLRLGIGVSPPRHPGGQHHPAQEAYDAFGLPVVGSSWRSPLVAPPVAATLPASASSLSLYDSLSAGVSSRLAAAGGGGSGVGGGDYDSRGRSDALLGGGAPFVVVAPSGKPSYPPLGGGGGSSGYGGMAPQQPPPHRLPSILYPTSTNSEDSGLGSDRLGYTEPPPRRPQLAVAGGGGGGGVSAVTTTLDVAASGIDGGSAPSLSRNSDYSADGSSSSSGGGSGSASRDDSGSDLRSWTRSRPRMVEPDVYVGGGGIGGGVGAPPQMAPLASQPVFTVVTTYGGARSPPMSPSGSGAGGMGAPLATSPAGASSTTAPTDGTGQPAPFSPLRLGSGPCANLQR